MPIKTVDVLFDDHDLSVATHMVTAPVGPTSGDRQSINAAQAAEQYVEQYDQHSMDTSDPVVATDPARLPCVEGRFHGRTQCGTQLLTKLQITYITIYTYALA